MRFAKIIATLGPACETIDVMREMVVAGVDVFRLNLSHGSHDIHAKNIQMVKQLQKEFNFAIVDEVDSILIDEARTP